MQRPTCFLRLNLFPPLPLLPPRPLAPPKNQTLFVFFITIDKQLPLGDNSLLQHVSICFRFISLFMGHNGMSKVVFVC